MQFLNINSKIFDLHINFNRLSNYYIKFYYLQIFSFLLKFIIKNIFIFDCFKAFIYLHKFDTL